MTSFFSRPIRIFGNVAVLVLCVVFFFTPFALRGARMSLERMENNVKDWLPSDFPETQDLEWFGKHFIGEQFVLTTWPGCREDEDRYRLLVKKLASEIAYEDQERAIEILSDGNTPEDRSVAIQRLKARELGDRYGLFSTGDYHQNWGGENERWLQGSGQLWHYITPDGGLYRWTGRPNVPAATWRGIQKLIHGKPPLDGELIARLGAPPLPERPNEFHADPRRVTARYFKSIQTGPELVEDLAREGGPLWPRLANVAEEDKPFEARKEALDRLTGTLFAPAVQPGFSWEADAFFEVLPESKRADLPATWREDFERYVDGLVRLHYEGDKTQLLNASAHQQSIHWDEFFVRMRVMPPPRQTAIILTLSEIGKKELARVIGRPVLGQPTGKLLDLATNECGISLADLKLGGPPVDNVAIDEEGTITLFRLIGWSAVIGICLSYVCFRSVKVTIMVFFVGGVAAISSLSIVWWSGASVDAVLMSMPSLVYVLGLSGAVHIVNYYREAVHSDGLEGAPERAIAHGWGPCTLAAFTTAIGLLSLYSSNLLPIKKFGLFSAIGVMATLTLLFTYLPAALQVWPPGYHLQSSRNRPGDGLVRRVESLWVGIGHWVIRRNALVGVVCLLAMVGIGLGLRKTETSVQLLKLFDGESKIIRDYHWLESNFGKLVPMELVVRVRPDMIKPPLDDLQDASPEVKEAARYQYSFLERMELAARVQKWVEQTFGDQGQDIIGQGLSAATFTPDLPPPSYPTARNPRRWGFNEKLLESRQEILDSDYLRVDTSPGHEGSELWRISLRLGALNDVDYGAFVHEQKLVAEPILTAHETRTSLLKQVAEARGKKGFVAARIGFLGVPDPKNWKTEAAPATTNESNAENQLAASERRSRQIDQTRIFASTLKDLLIIAGCSLVGWIDPNDEKMPENYLQSDRFAASLAATDCVVVVDDHPELDLNFVREHARMVIDARDHEFELTAGTPLVSAEVDRPLQVVYTGVVPVVYKAQRTLLNSLINSIAMAFLMICAVMMVLLRDWNGRLTPFNIVNVPGGVLSMVPNVFPVVIVFGVMGHQGIEIDIGTMMCASVAMGIAVDDTIHYLTWFRIGIREGLTRHEAIIQAYRRVATAMTQTTLIGGLGLSVFALSTFTPTQRFGVMMVTLLLAALVGDLIFLPAILASPLGRFFAPKSGSSRKNSPEEIRNGVSSVTDSKPDNAMMHAADMRGATRHTRPAGFRIDTGHS